MNHGDQLARMIFLTDTFKQFLNEHQLTGLEFIYHKDQGNLIWDAHEDETLNFERLTEYIRIEGQRFIDFFVNEPQNTGIKAFGIGYEQGKYIEYGFLDHESWEKIESGVQAVSAWPFTPYDFDAFKMKYYLTTDFLEEIEDEKEKLLEAHAHVEVDRLSQQVRRSIEDALKMLDFSHIHQTQDFQLMYKMDEQEVHKK
ncbi:MAG: hypothetical protein AAFR59_18725 [Bacteroidota bacterium]